MPAGRRRRRFSTVSGWIGFLTLDEPAIALLLRFRLRITGAPYAETILSLAFGGWEVTLDELELYDYPFTEDQVSTVFQATQPMR